MLRPKVTKVYELDFKSFEYGPRIVGCVDIRPMLAKRPTIKMTILTDGFQENADQNFKKADEN
jgi:hypothetical protein